MGSRIQKRRYEELQDVMLPLPLIAKRRAALLMCPPCLRYSACIPGDRTVLHMICPD